MPELATSALPYQRRQLLVVAGEEQEGPGRGVLLPHEQHRDERGQQQQGGGGAQLARVGQARQPLAHGAVADLVVVLQAGHETRGRQVAARLAARSVQVRRHLALVGETIAQAGRQQGRGILEILVVAFLLPSQQHVYAMVEVIGPLRVEARRLWPAAQQRRPVVLVFKHQVDMPPRLHRGAYAVGKAAQEALLGDCMDRIEPQAVEAIFVQPIQRILREVVANLRAAEVDGGAPGRVQVVAEERLGEHMDVCAVRTEMVIHHVQHDHQPKAMRVVDQSLQVVWRAIGSVRRERQHTVIAPVVVARKIRDWHDLDGCDAKGLQFRQALPDACETTHGPGVAFVDDGLVPRAAHPSRMLPVKRPGIDDDACVMDIACLLPGCGVGHAQPVRQPVAVAGPGRGKADFAVPAAGGGLHQRCVASVEFQDHLIGRRRPDTELRGAVPKQLGTER